MFGVENLDCPAQSRDLNPSTHVWDELDHHLHPQDLTDAHMGEWTQIPTAVL